MTDLLDGLVHSRLAGRPTAITSVCSAHPLVLEAALAQAAGDGTAALIEATSNQVDQFGGYTGMRPADFRAFVEGLADRVGLPDERVVLGGDHLGPNRWRSKPADEAMSLADDLVRSYVAAGYTKIHLDCSYPCADDDGVLSGETVASRAARMLVAAEAEAARVGLEGRLRYVIGTEVPAPGGADHALDALVPTTLTSARQTLDQHRAAFDQAGLGHVWPQMIGLVVQPGVEFDHLRVVAYDSAAARELRTAVDDQPHMVFEAHSTDYQTKDALRSLVADGWAVLKVGPALTFALREALFALAAIESELVPTSSRSALPDVVERRMLAEPGEWEKYYPGTPAEQALARRYSYSDRMRYYWPDPEIAAAVETLMGNLSRRGIPDPVLSAFLPRQYEHLREGLIDAAPRALVLDHIRDVLREYSSACRA
jgi:D-tagatose-1,6-bisphosphate aldolase subunit GatZ/KbaZ